MSISLIQRCSTTRKAEAHQQPLERVQDRPALRPRTPSSAVSFFVRSIIRCASVVLSGGTANARSLEDFDELPARAEEQHRAELRIEAAAEDQFVAVGADHRLHGHALRKCAAPACPRTDFSIAWKALDGLGPGEIELHAADVGLVRHRLANSSLSTTG